MPRRRRGGGRRRAIARRAAARRHGGGRDGSVLAARHARPARGSAAQPGQQRGRGSRGGAAMTRGERSSASKMWNRSWREEEIADYLGLTVSEVKRYLATRPGWPGRITTKPSRQAETRKRASYKTAYTNGVKHRAGGKTEKAKLARAAVKGSLAGATWKIAMRGMI